MVLNEMTKMREVLMKLEVLVKVLLFKEILVQHCQEILIQQKIMIQNGANIS